MTRDISVLNIEDSKSNSALIAELLHKGGYKVIFKRVETAAQMRAALKKRTWDVIISDLNLSKFDSYSALALLHEERLDIPFIIISDPIGEEAAIDLLKAGAHDLLIKKNLTRLLPAVERELEYAQVRRERKHSEDAALVNQNRFRALIENSLGDISLVSADGTLIWESPSVIHPLNYPPNELLGTNIFELLHPDDLEQIQNLFAEIVGEPASSQSGSFRLRRKDGNWRWVEAITSNLLHDPSVQAIVINYRDVTERKTMENEIASREQNYRSIMAQASDGIFSINPTGKFTDINPSGCAMLGYTFEELITKKITDLFPIEDLIAAPLRTDELRQGKTVLSDRRLLRKDGTLLEVEISVRMLSDGSFQGILHDISERKQAEDSLRESEQKYRSLYALAERREKERALIDEVSRALVHELDLTRILHTVVEFISRTFGYTLVSLYLLQDETLVLQHQIGYSNDIREIPITKGVSGRVARSGLPLLIEDVHAERAFVGAIENIVSEVCVPLLYEDQVIGILNVESVHKTKLSEADLNLMITLSEQISPAIGRAKLYTELGDNEKRFRALIENSADAIALVDTKGIVIYDSPAAPGMLGYAPEERIGKSLFELIHADDLPEVRELLLKLPETKGLRVCGTFRLLHKNNSWRWMEAVATNLLDEPSVKAIVVNYRDITERKLTQDMLLNNEERFNQLATNIQEAFWMTDIETGSDIYLNPAAEKIWGKPVEELLTTPESFLEFVLPEDREVVNSASAKHRLGEKTEIEYRIQRADGSVHWVWDRAFPIQNAQGKVTRVAGLAADITERKKLEIALLQSEQAHRSLFENVPVGLYRTSADGYWLDANPALIKMFGYEDRASFLAMKVEKVYADPAMEKKFFDEIIKSDSISSMEVDFRKKDGTIFRAEDHIQTIRDKNGNPLFYEGSLTDITERRRAEEELNKTRGDYQSLFNHANDVILIFEPEEEIILEVNAAACAIYGFSRDELIGMSLKKLTLNVTQGEAQIRDTLDNRSYRDFESIHINRNGQRIYFLINASIVEYQNKEAILSINHDITERKQAEKALRESEKSLRESQAIAGLGSYILDIPSEKWISSDILNQIFGIEESYTRSLESWSALIHPDWRQEMSDYLANEVLGNHIPFDKEYKIVRKNDGAERWVYGLGKLEFDADDQLVKLYGTIQDITGRKTAEELLSQQAVEYETMLSTITEGFWLVDEQGKLLDANSAYCSMSGYSKEELLQLTIQELDVAESLEETLRHIQTIKEAGTDRFESRHRTKAGGVFDVEINASFWRERKRFFVFIEDITEHKQSEIELKERTDDLELVNSLNEAINRGQSLETVFSLLLRKLKEIIRCNSATFYLLSPDENTLIMQNLNRSENLINRIEQLVGLPIPKIQIPIRQGTSFQRALQSEQGILITDPEFIRTWMMELTEADNLPKAIRGPIRKVVPQIIKLVDIRSTMAIPLILENKVFGLLDVSSSEILSEKDLNRIQKISSHLITAIQRKKAEDALRDSEQRYRTLFEDMPVSIWEEDFSEAKKYLDSLKDSGVTDILTYFKTNPEAFLACGTMIKILNVNQATLNMYHAKTKEELYKSMEEGLSESEVQHLNSALVAIAEGKINHSWEGADETVTGEPIEISLRWTVSPGYESDFSKVIVTTIDISERKRAEEALRESEERFRAIFEGAAIGIAIVDLSGHTIENNLALENLLGYDSAEFSRMVFTDFTHPDDIKLDWNLWQDLISRKLDHYRIEKRFIHKDGHIIWVNLTTSCVRAADGQMLFGVGMVEDITERKKVETDNKYQLSELEALYENGLAISSLLEPRQIAQRMVEVIDQKLNWHHTAIRLYEASTNRLELLALNSPGFNNAEMIEQIERINQTINSPDKGLSGWVVRHGEVVRIGNLRLDPRYLETYPGILSGLYIPIKSGDEVIGSITVESEELNAFSERDTHTLTTLASQAAISFVNARLYLQIQKELKERHQAEEEVRKLNIELEQRVIDRTDQIEATKRRLELATHAGQIGVWEYSLRENKVIWDERMHLIYKLASDEFDGTAEAWAQVIHPEDLEKSQLGRNQSHTNNPLFNNEYRIIWPDGSVRHIMASAVMVYSLEGIPERLIGINMDITDRKQIEQSLRESENYTRVLFNAIPDPISVTEVNGSILDINKAFEKQFNQAHEDLVGKHISDLGIYPQNELDKQSEYLSEVLQGHLIESVELDFYVPGDRVHTHEFRAFPLSIEGDQVVLNTSHDITAHKKAEEAQRIAKSEMERALRIKNEFLANMSHELRTPLNSILGISESLEEQIAGALNEKQLKYIGIVRESGRHLLELINDILDLSKIEAGQMKLEIHPVSIEKLCQVSLRMIKELAQKKSLNVSYKTSENGGVISGDERRLKQSLVNLLTNAVKFTPPGSRIGLEVQGNSEKNEMEFTVWDQGIGIAPADIQQLFKPFVQLDAGLTREYQGTGLGLALVAQMVELHGGRVRVDSELRSGSRFTITLPWLPGEQNTKPKVTDKLSSVPIQEANKNTNRRILLVEDTDVVVQLVSEYLRYKGYEVLLAHNGAEGVQMAIEEHPDLILMDVMMPYMNGLEATQNIRMDESLKDTPIIAMTALAMSGDSEKCIAAGMNDYLSKPIQMKHLADMIEKYMGPAGEKSNEK